MQALAVHDRVRGVIVATLKRDEMLSDGRDEEMEKMVQAARESQALLRKQASE